MMHKSLYLLQSKLLTLTRAPSRSIIIGKGLGIGGTSKKDKEPEGIKDMRLKANKEKPFNPLVICGPSMGGKVRFCF
jgi:hypothetical protein